MALMQTIGRYKIREVLGRLPIGLPFLRDIFVIILCSGVVLSSACSQGVPGGDSAAETSTAQMTVSASEAGTAAASPTSPAEPTADLPTDNPTRETAETAESEEEAAADSLANEISITSQLGQEIVARGAIRIGGEGFVVWPFSIEGEDGQWSGFEVILAEEIVFRLFGDEVSVIWSASSTDDALAMLEAGTLDLMINSTVHTTSRDDLAAWSSNYFLEGLRFMVPPNSPANEISDLDGAAICFDSRTTDEEVLAAYFEENGFTYTPVPLAFYNQIFGQLESGECDAAMLSWFVMLYYGYLLEEGGPTPNRFIGPQLTSEPFAIALPANSPDFRDEVDAALLAIIADGTWEEIYEQWFPSPHPWTLEEMLNTPPIDE